MRRLLALLVAAAGAAAGGWAVFARIQGDSLMVFEPETLEHVGGDARSLHGEVTIVNRGKVGGVVHKVEGRLVDLVPGRVLVSRKGTRPPEPGWWQSNCLLPGESCVAEVAVELESPASGAVTIELDVHEIGRRLKVHRTLRVAVPVPVGAEARETVQAPPGTA